MNEFYIENVRIVNPSEVVDMAWLRVTNGTIAEIGIGNISEEGKGTGITVFDGAGQWLVPGFIDIHVHGGDGADVMNGSVKGLQTIATFHASHGTTGWLPTTLTAPVDKICRVLESVDEFQKTSRDGARALGVHLEGPFLSIKRIGAQNPEYLIEPSVEACSQMVEAVPGLVRKMTIAPEVPGALQVIEWLQQNKVVPSLGHTDATYEETLAAVHLGHCHATHLFNGMRPMHHREGGVLAATMGSDNVALELIADGIHVQPEVMQFVIQAVGANRICLITDAMAAAGRPDGTYELGGLAVTVENGKAYLTEGHNIAGSTLTMDAALRNMVRRVGVAVQDGIRMASANPARELGLSTRKGAIAVGMDADLVLLDESFSVQRTWVAGTVVYQR